MSALRTLVIGSGWAAHSARAFATDARTELRAIVGRGSQRSAVLARSLSVPLEENLERALAEHRPEIVALAIGERAHEAIAIRCVEAGAHVLCAHPVAPDAGAVARIAVAAALHRRVVRTDYTFRLRPELSALADPAARGELIRVAIDAPGRWLPIALDTAVVIAGRVARLSTNRSYPPALHERAARLPQAFPPTVVLEHVTGVVTSIVPFPHAWPAVPVSVRTSWERARVEGFLPAGGARSLACLRGGAATETELVSSCVEPGDASQHARGMELVARAFVDAVAGADDALATLAEEAHLRAVWSTLWRARAGAALLEIPVPA